MAHYDNDFAQMLSSSLGEDPELVAQLQRAFLEAVGVQIDLMSRARCDGNWHVSAERLCGVAASFSAQELLELGRRASAGAPGDPAVIRELREWLSEFKHG